jgi:NDP-sugar pyrophosphorylase family protein
MNGDLITQFDVGRMIDLHKKHENRGTIGVQTYSHQVPFGVLETDGARVVAMREKPSLRYLVNAGIYVLDIQLRERLALGESITVPAILDNCLARGEQVGIAHVDEDWMDVGCPDELNRARGQS